MRPVASPPRPWADRPSSPVQPAQLEIHYQPIADASTGGFVGAEALLRRRMPSGVVQIAARFLPLAEATGLLVEIGRRVIDKACGQAATWQAFRRGSWVTVNLSSRQLADPALVEWVQAVLTRHALRPDLLVFDVPEFVIAEAALDGGPRLQHLRELDELGVRIAVDDAGTGAPAPSYLPFVPVSMLKIDGRVVRGNSALLPELVGLGKERGLVVLAEGVEQDEHLAEVTALGVDLVQGYAIGRATSPDRIAQTLRNWG
jgi:EAL domain-containing protein (putative c-di-GMP-specific phosphodiesterase class I)